MKWVSIFIIFTSLSAPALATTESELVTIIKVRCDFYNKNIPFDIREDCMLDYINCGVKLDGKIEIKDLDKCVANNRRK